MHNFKKKVLPKSVVLRFKKFTKQQTKMKQILVIGAGVNGLSSAVKIAENFYNQAQVTLISEETSPNTTGKSWFFLVHNS